MLNHTLSLLAFLQLLSSMTECLCVDVQSLGVWRQLYTKHLPQSRCVWCLFCLERNSDALWQTHMSNKGKCNSKESWYIFIYREMELIVPHCFLLQSAVEPFIEVVEESPTQGTTAWSSGGSGSSTRLGSTQYMSACLHREADRFIKK